MNTFGTSLELAGDNNEFRRHTGKPCGGHLFAKFKRGDIDSITRAARYVGATDEEIKILIDSMNRLLRP